MKAEKEPVMLEDYVRTKQKKNRQLRWSCAAVLLCIAGLLRLLFPASATVVRAWVLGDGQLNQAVEVFYACASEGTPLPEAVEAVCVVLDGA